MFECLFILEIIGHMPALRTLFFYHFLGRKIVGAHVSFTVMSMLQIYIFGQLVKNWESLANIWEKMILLLVKWRRLTMKCRSHLTKVKMYGKLSKLLGYLYLL